MTKHRTKKPKRKMPRSPGRPKDATGDRLIELRLGDERIEALKARSRYETTRNRISGSRQRVFVNELVRRAVDEFLERNPPRPQDAITAAMDQVAVAAV